MRDTRMYKRVACKLGKCRLSSKMYSDFVRELNIADSRSEVLGICEDYDINFDMDLLERSDFV